MNHQKTHQTNPLAPWDPLDAPLDPLAVIPFVHAAPGEARRRHERKELRVREVIDLRSLFFHNHYSCSPQNNRVTVRIHTMAAAR